MPKARMATRSSLSPEQANHVRLPNSQSEANATMVINDPKSITPTKAAKKDPKTQYYIFHLNDTKGQVSVIEKAQEGDKFKEEFQDSFKSPPRCFTSKTKFEKEFAKAKEADKINKNTIKPHKKSNTFASGSALSPEAKCILAGMSQNCKTDSFRADFHTHSRASQVVVALRLTNKTDEDAWVWKPDIMCPLVKGIYKDHCDPVIQEAFHNITHVPLPDLVNDPTGETQKVKELKKGNGYTVPLSLAITYFTIPFSTLKSKEEESAFIADKLNDIIDTMKVGLMNKTFKECLSNMQESYARSIYREGISFNMQNFVNKAVTRITKANKISNFFMHTTAQEVTNQLWATSTDAPEYEFEQAFEECNASSKEDEDDEEDEEDDLSEKQGKFINVN
jgi:hypothetical protein